jgi:hypothetical protein
VVHALFLLLPLFGAQPAPAFPPAPAAYVASAAAADSQDRPGGATMAIPALAVPDQCTPSGGEPA